MRATSPTTPAETSALSADDYRLEGAYEQSQADRFMQRVKVPGGVLSAEQASGLCEIGERYAPSPLHLTTRMSVEFHGVARRDLPEVWARLAALGLTSRGACGGAVRGIAVSTPFALDAARARSLARRLHLHFTGNPEFEGLPKKFKIGVDAGYDGSRHLIQDVGLVYAGEADVDRAWDVYLAGGLGREPLAGFLYRRAVPEGELLRLIEAALRVHRAFTPRGRRLKHQVLESGRETLVARIEGELREQALRPLPPDPAPEPGLPPPSLVARLFAGELPVAVLLSLSAFAREYAAGRLMLTPDQDLAFSVVDPERQAEAQQALITLGFGPRSNAGPEVCRVCPGSHDCRMGLAPTRDVARELAAALGPKARSLGWAVSGCPHSCAQPQLADVGILCARREKNADGPLTSLYDVYRRQGPGLAERILEKVPLEEVMGAARELG